MVRFLAFHLFIIAIFSGASMHQIHQGVHFVIGAMRLSALIYMIKSLEILARSLNCNKTFHGRRTMDAERWRLRLSLPFFFFFMARLWSF